MFVSVAMQVTLPFCLAQLQRYIIPPLNRTSYILDISIYINFTLIFKSLITCQILPCSCNCQVEGQSYKLIPQGPKFVSRLLSRRLWMNVCLDYGSMFSVNTNLAVQVQQRIGLRMARLCVTWSCQHPINSATVSCSAEGTLVLMI
jgi:hypothetical protein